MRTLIIVFILSISLCSYAQNILSNRYDEKVDTIEVLVLYTDMKEVNHLAHSVFSYEVIKRYKICCGGAYGDSFVDTYDHVQYLDHNKRPFRDSIIIWQKHDL